MNVTAVGTTTPVYNAPTLAPEQGPAANAGSSLQPDHYRPGQPRPGYPQPGHPQPGYPRHNEPNDGLLGSIGRILDAILGNDNHHYPQPYPQPYPTPYPQPYPTPYPQPYPTPGGGYIPPEPRYGQEMRSIVSNYDYQLQNLQYNRRYMSDWDYSRRERQLWQSTCDQIVRSWSPRDEKLGALGHVHTRSSSMYYSDFERYANRVGGFRPY